VEVHAQLDRASGFLRVSLHNFKIQTKGVSSIVSMSIMQTADGHVGNPDSENALISAFIDYISKR
jgi:hypothetical protein